jgi:uncharacterized Zn finger protein (UPF0148 family)
MNWQIRRCVHCPECRTTHELAPVARDDGRTFIQCPVCGIIPWRARLTEEDLKSDVAMALLARDRRLLADRDRRALPSGA